MRRVLAHLIAAVAYGLLFQSIIFGLLLTCYHAERSPMGFDYISFFDVAGYRLDPQLVVKATITTCTFFPLLIALIVLCRRPRRALEGTVPMVIHSLVIVAAILAHILILASVALLGRDGAF